MLQDEIDRSFGAGPEHRPVEHRIEAGRRALRRRRAASALTAVGMVAVLGTTYAALDPGLTGGATGEVAASPTPTPTPTPSATSMPDPTETPEVEAWRLNQYSRYTDDGALEIRPGVVVHEHIENPYGWESPRYSDALDLSWKGRRIWTLVELEPEGPTSLASVPSAGWATFADWVHDQVKADIAAGAAGNGLPEPLRLAADGRVVPASGVEVLQRTDDPQLGDRFAPPDAHTGAALVRTEPEVSYFVVWRVVDGTLDVICLPPRRLVGATFPEMLSYARSLYASDEAAR